MNSALPTAGPAFTDRATLAHTPGGLAKFRGRRVTLFSLQRERITPKSDGFANVLRGFDHPYLMIFALVSGYSGSALRHGLRATPATTAVFSASAPPSGH